MCVRNCCLVGKCVRVKKFNNECFIRFIISIFRFYRLSKYSKSREREIYVIACAFSRPFIFFTGTIESNIYVGNEKINRARIDSLKKVGVVGEKLWY